MMRKFKFFEGISDNVFVFNQIGAYNINNIDAEQEIINLLSQQISDEIDNEIVNELTRRINSGEPSVFEGPIERLNDNFDYLNHWLNMGGNRA